MWYVTYDGGAWVHSRSLWIEENALEWAVLSEMG